MATSQARISIARVTLFGAVTTMLYLFLYLYESHILDITRQGQWSFLVPITIAFAFSYFHGSFTGGFWEVLGIQAKK